MEVQKDTPEQIGFQARERYVHADADGRLSLDSVACDTDYCVLVNARGQILLDPVVSIPPGEAWLWQDPLLRASMERALGEAKTGTFEELGSFMQFAREID